MLSEVARLYDPLGWLAPIIVVGKILIQQLWLSNIEWDQPVDADTATSWLKLREQLPGLESLIIPRWLGTTNTSRYYLHGYADASQRAYAAVVYLVVTSGCEPPKSDRKSVV